MRPRTALLILLVSLSPRLAAADKPAPPTAPAAAPAVLDLEVVPNGALTTVRDAAYTIDFPWAPELRSVDSALPSGAKLVGAIGLGMGGARGAGMMMLPVPKDMSYDAKVGLTAARDGILEAITGTIVSDKPGKLGGLPGRAVRAKAVLGHKPYRVDLLLAWDATHHTMVGLYTMAPAESTLDRAPLDAFFASFKVKPGAAPPAVLTK
jgi:hypothetical protein